MEALDDVQTTRPLAHILEIPNEIRLVIYQCILDNIHKEARDWERDSSSAYDGLLLTCQQLHVEANVYVFAARVTQHQLLKLTKLPTSRTAYYTMRSLCIEIDHDMERSDFVRLTKTLDHFQLSLQELSLLFYGQDQHGNEVTVAGCPYQAMWDMVNSKPLLLASGQHTQKQLLLLRQLTIMRNLRVLRIENANLPILPAVFILNKPFLQAFSARCDPRSIVHTFEKWRQMPRLLHGLLTKISSEKPAPIEALHVDANAIVSAGDVILWLSRKLKHLSWRAPNIELQGRAIARQQDFYAMTGRMIQILWDRVPCLETLRLCYDMPNLPDSADGSRDAFGHLAEILQHDLHKLTKLRHFELHCNSSVRLLKDRLVERLPDGLRRFYISDRTIDVDELVEQIDHRYLSDAASSAQLRRARQAVEPIVVDYAYVTAESDLHERAMTRNLASVPKASRIWVGGRGSIVYKLADGETKDDEAIFVLDRKFSSKFDYLNDKRMIGESKLREDEIPLNTGKLGFVTFEYDWQDESEASGPFAGRGAYDELTRTKLLRVNGRLLDREHNMHLADKQAFQTDCRYVAQQARDRVRAKLFRSDTNLPETETYSKHATIYAAIYNSSELIPKPYVANRIREEFAQSLRDANGNGTDPRFDWYFGNEEQAMEVFKHEPVARIEDQKARSMPVDVEVMHSKRCQWLCPDFEVPPVGTFPAPVVPSDWKKSI